MGEGGLFVLFNYKSNYKNIFLVGVIGRKSVDENQTPWCLSEQPVTATV